jgi:endonuclease/exonuclease/phosphatase (EEP) superfamily protein YafD
MFGLVESIKPVWRRFTATLKRHVVGRTRGRWIFDAVMVLAMGALAALSIGAVASAWWPILETFGNLQVHIAAACAALLLVALLGRSNGWTLVAAAALVFNVVSVGLRVAPVAVCPVLTAATGHHPVHILTHNIWGWNHDLAALEGVIRRQGPDVVVLQEIRPHHRPLLDRLRTAYPYQTRCEMNPDCGIAILSRYPFETRREVGGTAVTALEIALTVEGRKLVLVGAHVRRPFHGRAQSAEFRALTPIVSGLPANAVIVGDFNSVLWSPNMTRYVEASGVCAGNTTHATWPEWLGPLGIPIDHIFLKQGVRLLSIATLDGTGSDHRALLATVGIP